jgi:ribosome-binding ATPase YchF (GTP1/OBG family)
LGEGQPARAADLTEAEVESVKGLMLLTMKKVNLNTEYSYSCSPNLILTIIHAMTYAQVIYAANVSDSDLATGNAMSKSVKDFAENENSRFVLVSAQVESELCGFDADERAEYMEQLEVKDEDFGLPVIFEY